MIEKPHRSVDRPNDPPDYPQKIADFLAREHPDVTLPERTIRLMAVAFDEMHLMYGKGQTDETRREYHNDDHAFEVFERSAAWLKRFEEQFGLTFTTEDYEVVGLAAAYHDIVIGARDETTSDEALSAQVAVEAMRASPEKFGSKMRRRVKCAVEATTVEYRDGNVFQTHVLRGKPDFAIVAVALADSGAVITESESTIIEHVSKLAMEHVAPGETDVTLVTEAVMKILAGEEKFADQRLDDLKKYIEFLSGDPDKTKQILQKYFAGRRERILGFTARIDSRLGDIQQTVTDTLSDSKETTERAATKIYRGIMRGLAWLPPSG